MSRNEKDPQSDVETRKKLLATQKSNDRNELRRVLKNMPLTDDTTCGFGSFKGPFLQKFANQTAYVIVYGFAGCALAATSSYFHGTITTLEKRYKIPSRNSGIIMMGNDFSQVLWSAFLGYYAGKRHRPRWMAFGLMTLILFCILTVTPHFIYGAGEDALSLTLEYGAISDTNISSADLQQQQQKRLCRNDGTGVECEVHEGILLPQIFLFLGQFVAGIGDLLYHTLGISYMDDNTEKSKAPAMLSLSYFFGLLGPSLGYTLASICLRLYIAPQLTPIITQSDSRWLGAWWIGWLIIAGLIFIIATLLFMFPKELPLSAGCRMLQDSRAKSANDGRSLEHLETHSSFRDMLKTFKKFLNNKIVTFNLTANIFFFFGYLPFWIFTAKYIEIQYRQSAATSSMVTGTVALVFSAIGILLAGIIISKFKPSARCLAGWNILVDMVTVCGMFAYVFIGCAANDNSLINNSYDSALSSSLSCNSICHCDYVSYSPVCGEDQKTYISPCHAGCKKEHMDVTGHKSYYDCSCIPNIYYKSNDNSIFNHLTLGDINSTWNNASNLSLGTGGQAVDGACSVNCTNQFYTFLAVMCVIKLFAASGRASNLLITMRSVSPEDKSAIMGFSNTLVSIFFVPAPVFYGWIFDQHCVVWGKTCTNMGNCWSYDSMNLRFTLNIVAASFIFLGTFCNVGVWYHVKHLKVFDDEEDKSKEMEIVELQEEQFLAGNI